MDLTDANNVMENRTMLSIDITSIHQTVDGQDSCPVHLDRSIEGAASQMPLHRKEDAHVHCPRQRSRTQQGVLSESSVCASSEASRYNCRQGSSLELVWSKVYGVEHIDQRA